MILKLLCYAKEKLYIFLTALVLIYCVFGLKYYQTGSLLTTSPPYSHKFRKLKPFFERNSFSRSTTTNVNGSKIPHQHEVKKLNSTESELNKTYSENSTTLIGEGTTFIDLDDAKPPIHFLYDKLTLVTSFSQNHYKEGLGFIGSAQQQMPNKTIIVYNLGLHKKEANKLVLDEFGVVYYGDASIRFKKPLRELLPDCIAHHGFLGQIRCFDPKVPPKSKFYCHHDYRITKNEMYAKIGVNKTEYYKANFSSPALSGGLMLLVNSTTMQQKIMKPWLRCAQDVTCIAPKGSSLHNHRFDQSALSLTVFKNMRGEWNLENDPTPHHDDVVSVSRGTNGEKWHPKTCS